MKSFRNNKTNRRVSKKQKHTRKYKGGTKDAAENIIAEFVKGERKANLTIIREQIKLLTKKTVNSTDKHNSSLLHQAVSFGNEGIVLLLLEKGANINILNRLGWTPLHSAVEFENESLLKLLLEKGAKTDIEDKTGQTPLEKAEEAMLTRGRPVEGIVHLLKK